MAAYAASVSLVQILHPDHFPPHLRNLEIESLHAKVIFLNITREKIFRITKNIRQQVIALDGRIRDALYRAQDHIEYLIINRSLSSENTLQEIIADIDRLSADADEIASLINKEMLCSPAVKSLAKMLYSDNGPLAHFKSQLDSTQYEKLQSGVQNLYGKLCSLQSYLNKICAAPKSIAIAVNDLDVQIREAATKAQDTIKSFITSSQTDSAAAAAFLQDLQDITANIDQLSKRAEKEAVSINEDQQAQGLSSENAETFKPKKKIIIGQEAEREKLNLALNTDSSKLEVLPIIGLPGSGKTTLARSIYEDSSITDEFDVHGWDTVTQDHQDREIFLKLLDSMETKGQKAGKGAAAQSGKNENLKDAVYDVLRRKKYLVVVDDIWEKNVWDTLKLTFPDDNNGSRIILTTRANTIAEHAKSSDFLHVMEPLSNDGSWQLLTLTVFGERGSCPPHLEYIGWKISKNCKGLPLSLEVVGGLLSQESKTEEYWKSIEEDTLDAANKGEDAYLEILYLSYYNLPGRLKGCFLYMGAFPENSEILVTKLVQLWVAEGFLKPRPLPWNVEQVAKDYLQELIDRNLLEIRKFTSNNKPKACGMNSSLRAISMEECGNEKFFHSIEKYKQILPEGTKTQRRISVHQNVLMCMKEVRSSVEEITCPLSSSTAFLFDF